MIEIRLLFVLHLLLVLHSYSCEHTLLSPIWNPWSKQYNWLDEDGRTSTLRFSFNPRRHPSTSSPRWDALCRWITVSEMLLMLDQHCRCRDRAFHLNCNCCVVEQQGVLNRLNPQYMLHQKSILIPQRIKQKDQFSSPRYPKPGRTNPTVTMYAAAVRGIRSPPRKVWMHTIAWSYWCRCCLIFGCFVIIDHHRRYHGEMNYSDSIAIRLSWLLRITSATERLTSMLSPGPPR